MHLASPISLLGLSSVTFAALDCRPAGPTVPRAKNLAHSSVFTATTEDLTSLLDQAVAGDIAAGWAVPNATFSLALVSVSQEDPGIPLWEYHHLADANANGTEQLDRDSQYLIGSVSKAFSALVLLLSDVELDAPVTDYLPELASNSPTHAWDQVSLRSLGDHLSGAPTNYGFADYYYLAEYFQSLGFPAIDNDEYPICGVIGLSGDCTKEKLLEGVLNARPNAAPMEQPVYSNLAFTLFILACEAATGKNYTTLVKDLIAEPLGMKNTSPSPGDSSRAVIPPVDNSWGSDYGINAPAGGLVSSLSDLSIFTHSILSRNIPGLTASQIRAWLKPHALTGSPHGFVGMPWEIFRPGSLLPHDPSQTLTFIAKSGGAYGYRSHIALLDSHGVALVLATAGDMFALPYMYDAMLSTLIPAVDLAAREEASSTIVGSFASSSPCEGSTTNSSTPCVEATLVLEETLELTSLARDGKDILAAISELWLVTVGAQLAHIVPRFRFFPTEEIKRGKVSGRDITKEVWRAWFEPEPANSKSGLPGQGISAQECVGWTLHDWIHYGSEPVDRMLVVRDAEDGDVIGVEFPFLRSGILELVELVGGGLGE
ncbi:uncharacterized protein DNG_09013 [Cephalotrichum gorgonifer]|uniref:Beta-lactamase-related domain-containing protein n=1 Tax=Cephalotrichum gorgonifer TaxID=2041049 RepID=A0AAE8N642_9PEZI|nr:uncharacterized protein DNG_09013 [Cephalotrichum gorgonifer]